MIARVLSISLFVAACATTPLADPSDRVKCGPAWNDQADATCSRACADMPAITSTTICLGRIAPAGITGLDVAICEYGTFEYGAEYGAGIRGCCIQSGRVGVDFAECP